MNQRFVLPRRVEFIDTDMAGIVHFATFFRYMETAEHEMFRALGLRIGVQDQEPHIGWPRVSCGFDFMKPLRFGENLEVHIGVRRIGKKSVTYEADIRSQGELRARGHSTSACCQVGPDRTMISIPVPEETATQLRTYLIDEPCDQTEASTQDER